VKDPLLLLRVPHAPYLRVGFLNLLPPLPFLPSEISNPKFEISDAVAFRATQTHPKIPHP
jgi:hypothetical protein